MKSLVAAALIAAGALTLRAETPEQRGKRVVDECVQALGGDRFLKHAESRGIRPRLLLLS